MRFGALTAVAAAALALTACADVGQGVSAAAAAAISAQEMLSIESDPPGARCRMLRGSQDLGTVTTPDRIAVTPSADDILILCEKPHYRTASAVLHANAPVAAANPGGGAGWSSGMTQPPRDSYEPVVRLVLTAVP